MLQQAPTPDQRSTATLLLLQSAAFFSTVQDELAFSAGSFLILAVGERFISGRKKLGCVRWVRSFQFERLSEIWRRQI